MTQSWLPVLEYKCASFLLRKILKSSIRNYGGCEEVDVHMLSKLLYIERRIRTKIDCVVRLGMVLSN